MNPNLEERLENFRIILLNYLFDNDEEIIDCWNNNQKIKITKKFNPLLQGDWSRCKDLPSNKLNLDNLKNTKITKNDLFELLEKELNIKKSKEYKYSFNFNPNLFFLLFDKFYEKYKFVSYKDKDDKIKGIIFLTDTLSRPEIRKIIEMHSRLILNLNLQTFLGIDKYIEYFIEKCYIQYNINCDGLNKYIDLCYIIEKKELLLEYDESEHHDIDDYIRKVTILFSSGSKYINYNVKDPFCNNDKIYKKMIEGFCKILYTNYKSIAVKIYLTEIQEMDISFINVGISIRNSEYKLKLSELITLPFFDEQVTKLDIDEIIKNVYKKGNIKLDRDFSNSYIIDNISSYKCILRKKNELEFTSRGIKNYLYSINGNDWSRRDDYIDFSEYLEIEYVNIIETLIKDDSLDIIKNECNKYKSIIYFLQYDQSTFFERAKKIFNNKIHKTVPFIIKSDENFVEFNILSKILNQTIKDNINIYEFDKGYIVNYRFMNKIELNQIYQIQVIDDSNFID